MHTRGITGTLAVLLLAAFVGAACHRTPAEAAKPAFSESSLAAPSDPTLALGQKVYRGDCANCHNIGKKGAPRIGDAAAWTTRLGQGLPTLIAHATQGYSGPAGDEMPARGGNDALTDAEVAAAVAYLTAHSSE
ncbi:MAG TPA: c-type cytochrome [Opitutaceae bacterium]